MTARPNPLARGIAIALETVAILCYAAVVSLMLFLVVARYVLGLSIIGLHELMLLFAIQLYMAGALIASRRRDHLTVDWLPQRLTGRARAANRILVAAVTIVVTGFFILWAYRMLAWGIERPQTTPALGLPLWLPQAAIMVAAIGSFGYALRDLIDAVRAYRA